MKYYKVIYSLNSKNERIYPSGIKEAVWNMAQYHFRDNIMIGRTDSEVEVDGVKIIELTEDEALSLIEEIKKSFPKVPEEELLFLPEEKGYSKSASARGSKKKSGSNK